jgi:ABC-type multidrug transport system permease subunit
MRYWHLFHWYSFLIQQNYKFAAALITISIIFVYSLINPDAFEVIQYRVIDTIIEPLSLSLPIIYFCQGSQ